MNTTNGSCTTLGNACAASTECCSANCQGGVCVQAYSCNAYGDVCYLNQDCCSGLCSTNATTTVPSTPGRCLSPSGGCTEDGNPCAGASNCCTRLCVDLGSGATVCAVAGGCRMTGDYCDPTEFKSTTPCTTSNVSTTCWPTYGNNSTCSGGFCTNPNGACCGGNADQLNPNGYGVKCEPKQVGAPPTCSNGQSCNPAGNICGGSGTVNASQNCCDGKKAVCKADSSGIMRCFGGCPNDDCSKCPTGYDPNNPGCCIEAGQVCQFSDQCCNGAPCVPDSSGVLRCALTGGSCLPQGDTCDPTSGPPCCTGLTCTSTSNGYECLSGSGGTCGAPGSSCTSGDQCCTGICWEGVVCASCLPDETGCTSSSQCCSAYCDPTGHCATQGGTSCVVDGGNCTVNGDCCTPDTCVIQPGDTSGKCTAPVAPPSCAQTSQSCSSTMPCCSATDQCNNGVCGPPPPTCSGISQTCTSDASCCSGLQCFTLDSGGNEVPCAGSACFCDTPPCRNVGESCSMTVACCTGYCADASSPTQAPCSASSPSCTCVNAL